MPQSHVGDLMRKRSRKLRFVLRGLDKPAGDVYRATRQRPGIDSTVAHDFEPIGITEAGRPVRELAAKCIDVGLGIAVIDELKCPFSLASKDASHFDVLLLCKHIPRGPDCRPVRQRGKNDQKKSYR